MKRDPIVLVGVAETIAAVLVAFAIPGITPTLTALILAVVAAVAGLLQAAYGSETWLNGLLGVARTTLALVVGLGLDVTDAQMGSLMAATAMLGSLFLRTQGTPLATPTLKNIPSSPGI